MKPVLIQHLIRQLKKTQPKKIVEDTAPQLNGTVNSTAATIFILLLALVILIVALD